MRGGPRGLRVCGFVLHGPGGGRGFFGSVYIHCISMGVRFLGFGGGGRTRYTCWKDMLAIVLQVQYSTDIFEGKTNSF
jgi:hypothetical protein